MQKYLILLRATRLLLGRRQNRSVLSVRYLSTEVDMTELFTNKTGAKSNLRHISYMEKCHGNLPPPSVIDVQVVGCGYPGTPRCLLINLNMFKYLFNCGEATQRICREHKMKPSKIQDIFFTRKRWENVSGLVSLCFSMESMGVPGVRLHGPKDLEKLVTEAKGFTQTRNLKLQIVKRDISLGSYEDSAMWVHYIPMKPKQEDIQQPVTKKPRLADDEDDCCVAYLCQPKPKTRNVDLEKCVELGVSSGVMIGQLTKGQTVTLDDGKVIQPEDILAKPQPNPPFLVLECPTISHLISLLENPRIKELHNCDVDDASPCAIFHMTEEEVLNEPEYQDWMKSFPESTKHIILNEKCPNLIFEGVYKIQTMLNMVHSEIFPLLPDIKEIKVFEENSAAENVIWARTNMKYIVRGRNSGSVITDSCISLRPDEYRDAVLKDEKWPKLTESEVQSKTVGESVWKEPFPELLFLGTGSAEPNKVRNVSGIWLNISDQCSMLLDCGENSLGQLLRHYGSQTDDVIARLKAVFISHLHADHHLGLTDVALYRRKVLQRHGHQVSPLFVIASKPLHLWNEFLADMFPAMTGLVRVIPVEMFNKNFEGVKSDEYSQLLTSLDMKDVESVRVRHGGIPYGLVLTHNTGWKLVYSGDTMPAQGLVKAGMNCDLLIHEATMEDDMTDEAQAKKHSTTSQAIQIGKDMNAKFILLTHFSQRYPKIPLFNDNFSEKVGIAFDNMRVHLNELHLLPSFNDKLKSVFAEEISALEQETIKRTEGKRRKKTNKGKCTEETQKTQTLTQQVNAL